MLYPIETTYQPGFTLYAVIRGTVGGVRKVWNETAQAWEVYSAGNWSQYAVPLTEDAGSGYYAADYPAAISGVHTTEALYATATSPAIGDAPASGVGQSQGSNVSAVGGEPVAAANLAAALGSQTTGALIGTPTALLLQTDLADTLDDVYVGRMLIMTSGLAVRQG